MKKKQEIEKNKDTEMTCKHLYEYVCNPFPRKLWIAVSEDIFQDKLEEVSKFESSYMACTGICNEKDSKEIGVLIRFKSTKTMDLCTIVHECVHAALQICDDVEADTDIHTQEWFAYFVEWFVKCCLEVKEKVEKENKN